ncbi:MAG: MetQ/NlpA family ABC transporter substrate-binding protein [Clostridiales bacterium]|nr:MetQ/NlpA family ABC transporter substrate-binding protein [Eubacterium sp.]MDD7348493.1 MetQ/NlpA family ABC transporter substrate-binding protein [Clostridiales bacterium]
MKKFTKVIIAVLIVAFALSVAGCGNKKESRENTSRTSGLDNYSPENPVTVKIGLTAAIYEDIWNPIKEELAKEGINIEYVQFSDYALPNEALENGEINLTAQQHHAYMENQIKENGWDDLVAIADTFIIAMNLYSDKIKDVSEIKDGDKIAVPNDATNEGRALKLLANAGLFTFKEGVGPNPEVADIEKYNKKIELVEVNASDTYSILPDVTAAVVNGNYALDAGIDPNEEGIFFEEKYDSNAYFCVIGARKAEAESKAYKRIVEAFQSEGTKKIFQEEFKGYFKPAWEYKID